MISLSRLKNLKRIKSFGSSMYPLLQDGDTVIFQKVPFGRIKVNDIVAVEQRGLMLTHRVIYRTGKYLITKGDNNQSIDKKVYQAGYIALVAAIVRNGRELSIDSFYLLQSTYYFKEIIRIKSIFEAEKIKYVFLKGLPLHLFYERHHPRRVYNDSDVLIGRENYLAVERILTRLGYVRREKKLFNIISRNISDICELTYVKQFKGFSVTFDVHFDAVFLLTQIRNLNYLYPIKYIDLLTRSFIENRRIVKIQNHSFPILREDHLIVYLALHFFHHNYRGIFRLDFLRKVIEKTQVSKITESMSKLIDEFKLGNYIYLSFLLVIDLYQLKKLKKLVRKIKFSKVTLINKFKKEDIFRRQTRFEAGIERFKLIYMFSPRNNLTKVLVFVDFRVIYLVFSIIYQIAVRRMTKLWSKLGLNKY